RASTPSATCIRHWRTDGCPRSTPPPSRTQPAAETRSCSIAAVSCASPRARTAQSARSSTFSTRVRLVSISSRFPARSSGGSSAMAEVRTVLLELLRAGPAHNQLLSPLTPYIALCGSEGPATVHLPFEHRQLLNRLERLRYLSGSAPISTAQRESEVIELGAAIGSILTSVPVFSAQ